MSKILIVEDNEKNRRLFKLVVESMGHEPLLAENGEVGVEAARQHHPALILMDIQMPVMDGVAALQALKAEEKTRDIPVLAITSFAMKGDRERLLAQGFSAYVAKPIDVTGFMATVKTFL